MDWITLADEVWAFTKPEDVTAANFYKKILRQVVQTSPLSRYRQSFRRPKKSGGFRIIRPATRGLHIVESFLTDWILRTCRVGNDYCYINGQGVHGAVFVHQQSTYALVVDLKDAFNFVTASKLKSRLQFFHREIPERVLDAIVDLLTFEGITPQGCTSTPYFYNLVLLPLDQAINLICKPLSLKYTRYADNMCISADHEFDLSGLETRLRKAIKGFGFEVSWSKKFVGKISYIGVTIESGQYSMDMDTYGKILDILLQALASTEPLAFYHQVLGEYNWTRQVYANEIPDELFDRFYRYFKRIHKIPPSLRIILNEKLHHGRLF